MTKLLAELRELANNRGRRVSTKELRDLISRAETEALAKASQIAEPTVDEKAKGMKRVQEWNDAGREWAKSISKPPDEGLREAVSKCPTPKAFEVKDDYVFVILELPDMTASGVMELSDGTKTDWESIELYAKVRRTR